MSQDLYARSSLFKKSLFTSLPKLARLIITASLISAVSLILFVAWFEEQHQPQLAMEAFAQGSLAGLRAGKGERAPEGAFSDVQAHSRYFSEWRGQVILVNLWGVWCPPCVEELPGLAGLARDFDSGDFSVIAIALDRQAERERVWETLSRLSGGDLDFYFDPDWTIAHQAGASGFPTSLLYDRSGRLLARLDGAADWSSPEAQALIEAVLNPGGSGMSFAQPEL